MLFAAHSSDVAGTFSIVSGSPGLIIQASGVIDLYRNREAVLIQDVR
jgi:hypothetical protein